MNDNRERYLNDMVSDIYNKLRKDLSIPDWVEDQKIRGIAEYSLKKYFEEHEEEITTFYDRGKF